MTRCASAHDAAQSLYGLRADLCLCDAVGDGVEVAMSGHAHLLKWQWQLHHDGRLNIGPPCPYRRLERQLRCLFGILPFAAVTIPWMPFKNCPISARI